MSHCVDILSQFTTCFIGDVGETDCVSAKTENGFKWASSAHDDYDVHLFLIRWLGQRARPGSEPKTWAWQCKCPATTGWAPRTTRCAPLHSSSWLRLEELKNSKPASQQSKVRVHAWINLFFLLLCCHISLDLNLNKWFWYKEQRSAAVTPGQFHFLTMDEGS